MAGVGGGIDARRLSRQLLSISRDSVYVDKMCCLCHAGGSLIPAFDPETGALPPGDHPATLDEIRRRLGFTPRRSWLLKGLGGLLSRPAGSRVSRRFTLAEASAQRSRIPAISTGTGSSPIPESTSASILTGSTSNWSWSLTCECESGGCGPIMESSSSSTPRCRRALRWGSQSSFGGTGTGGREA